MKKTVTICFLFISCLTMWSHEGMWIPSLLKALEGDMQSKGLQLSADDIYSINHSSLKDAIVHFGGGCTAEVISNKGLILTNHHCGYSQIQQHSTIENNYLKNGFWAMSLAEELKNLGLTATFIVRIEDVTSAVLEVINSADDQVVTNNKIALRMKVLTEKAIKGTNYQAEIRSFYYGNEYYMIVTKTYKDVRLVGAPPSSMGKFGRDTDNWMWPRHTCDFSVFRIYADNNNNPAEISDNNIPYTPEHHLPVSLEGVKENDFTMVFGFPGRTQQFLTSFAVKDYIQVINPTRINMRKKSLSIIDAAMSGSEATFIKYAAKQSRISNAYKKWIGQNLGLNKKDAINNKKDIESRFSSFNKSNVLLLKSLEENQKAYIKYDQGYSLFKEIWYYGPEIIRFGYGFDQLLKGDYSTGVKEKKNIAEDFFKNYELEIDQKIFEELLPLYLNYLDDELESEYLNTKLKTNKNSIKEYASYLYSKSMLTSMIKVNKLLSMSEKSFAKNLKKDPVYLLAMSIRDSYLLKVRPEQIRLQNIKDQLMKQYVAAQKRAFTEKTFWADANSTLRLTYGKVEGTYPRDGIKYTFITTLDGIIEKNNTGNSDYEIPDKLRTLWENKDYGRYGNNGQLNICFLGSNHTTGGNSGSPALNGEGHLIGINFDRSWESTMSDVMFDPDICRNIMVDIRYVLWVIDIYAGAGHLTDEMTVVDEKYRKKIKEKDLKLNISQLTNQLRDVPGDARSLELRSDSYFELGNYDLGLKDLNDAISGSLEQYKLLNKRAAYFESIKNYESAFDDVYRSIKIESVSNAEAYFIRGTILSGQAKYKDAIKDFERVLKIDHAHYKSYYNIGVCCAFLGEREKACKNFELAKLWGGDKCADMFHLLCDPGIW